jgi:hypothetical protein
LAANQQALSREFMQACAVMPVIRTSDGEIGWMDVSAYLKRESTGGKTVRQIVFAGEPFDVMSGRRYWGRNRVESRRRQAKRVAVNERPLSACESGAGEIKIGEGVMSLRRAIRIAGAETVLASHWPVSNKATGRLMTEFMRRWRAGEPRATAWREAQLALLRSPDFSSPYFWAAFTLTGQWR